MPPGGCLARSGIESAVLHDMAGSSGQGHGTGLAAAMLIGALPGPRRKLRVSGLVGSSEALATVQVARERSHVVFIARDVASATRLSQEIRFFDPDLRVLLFPDWEVLPYERFSPPRKLVAERLRVLSSLSSGFSGVTVLAAHTLMYPVPTPEHVGFRSFVLETGATLDVEGLVARLSSCGYERTDRVTNSGEFAVHGGQFDLYPSGAPLPVRIVLDDNSVEEIRLFDPETQRSVEKKEAVEILPACEYPLDRQGRDTFCANFLEMGGDFSSDTEIYRSIRNGQPAGGIEFFLPLFFGAKSMFLDHVPEDAVILSHQEVHAEMAAGMGDACSRHESIVRYEGRPAIPPPDLFHDSDSVFARIKEHAHVEMCPDGVHRARRCPVSSPPSLEVKSRTKQPFTDLKGFLGEFGGKVVLTSSSVGRRDMMRRNLEETRFIGIESHGDLAGHEPMVRCDTVAPLHGGFVLDRERIAYVTEYEVYRIQAAPMVERLPNQSAHAASPLLAIEDIREGDPIVHRKHGIGFYRGLATVSGQEHDEEFIVLEYADNASLMVPVGHLHTVGRYIGGALDGEVVPDTLGSSRWRKRKEKAQRKVRDIAVRLLDVQARRELKGGVCYQLPAKGYAAFAAQFGYLETPDQQAAINDVLADLQVDRSMDRLVCGDVGYGKTEVALRAAYVVAANGRQVAVLSPTTILASQHYQVFSDRFSGFPYKVGEFSRIRSSSELADAAAQVASGEISIAIGTHQLLQKGFKFKNLGLVIVDEEHRFGVRQKEQLKALRNDIEVLTMTATPIPRTLAMALEGISDFSLIASAPEGRTKVITFVADYRKDQVVDAIKREVMRGGQVFYLHNDIATMQDKFEQLESWMPDIRFRYVHGRMPKTDLEKVMRGFYRQECDVLVTTTIVELGIDIPNANTMVIERADRLGLAQLHQLRGRVGRSHRQAYAYLLTEPEIKQDSKAYARLMAIRSVGDQGGGYGIAMRDLEIRGAGNVLGEEQSGQIEAVGYTMYRQMLDAAVRAFRKGELESADLGEDGGQIEVEIDASCLLPESYCPSVNERLNLYRRMGVAASQDELGQLEDEIVDRFGIPPVEVRILFEVHRFRVRMGGNGIRSVRLSGDHADVRFCEVVPYAEGLVKLAMKGEIQLMGSDRIKVPCSGEDAGTRLNILAGLMESVSGFAAVNPAS